MVSITACLKNRFEPWRVWAIVFGLLFTLAARAAEIEISNPELTAVEDGYAVSADFAIDFNERLEEAVTKGVVLNFVVDFELTRPRWYWLDEKLVSRSLTYRLSYHALTRQYRLSTGALHQSFPNLSEALRMLSRLRNWVVIEKAPDKSDKVPVKPGDAYRAALRLRLDVSQLPKPFQISALGNRDWHLASDWKVWQATLPAESK
ncbi:MAG: putative proline rich signal peptide protein [Rhodocyclaceae bacterium]|nr:putative proline rich signal peptide protein [Rhodocyclaceae bacterium]